MEKSSLSRFVSKYNLAGLVESVKWEVKEGSLHTSFISGDKSVLGSVSMTEFNATDATFGVYDTSKLMKMLSVLGDDIDFSLKSVGDKLVSLSFKGGSTTVNYMLADLSVIPNVPDLKKIPEFDINIKLDTNFINTFIKAKGALADESIFTFFCEDGNGPGKIILGYSNMNTNRISIDVDCTCNDSIQPISFSATYLKEILIANREATDAVLKISSEGLAHVYFEIDNYKSNYYLVQITS